MTSSSMDVEDDDVTDIVSNVDEAVDTMTEDISYKNVPSASVMTALEEDAASQVITQTNVQQPRLLSAIDDMLANETLPEPEQELEDNFDYEKAEADDMDDANKYLNEEELTSAQMSLLDTPDADIRDADIPNADIPDADIPNEDRAYKENKPEDNNETYVRQVVSQLPISVIKRIMKMDPETKMVQNESVLLLAFATELFIKTLSTASARVAVKNKRKTIKKEDIDHCIQNLQYFEFLEDMI